MKMVVLFGDELMRIEIFVNVFGIIVVFMLILLMKMLCMCLMFVFGS